MKLIFNLKIMNKNYLWATKISRKWCSMLFQSLRKQLKYGITNAFEFSPNQKTIGTFL